MEKVNPKDYDPWGKHHPRGKNDPKGEYPGAIPDPKTPVSSKSSKPKSKKGVSSPLQMLNLAAAARSKKGKKLLLEEQEALQELSQMVSARSNEVKGKRHKPEAAKATTSWLKETSDVLLEWVPIVLSALALL